MNTEPDKTATPTGAGHSAGLAKRGVLKLAFTDEKSLYESYMPFVKGCGIFVPSEETYKIGDEAFLLLSLPNNKGKFAVSAKVVWINPKQKMGKRLPGAGLQVLGKDATNLKETVEGILGKRVKAALSTYTM